MGNITFLEHSNLFIYCQGNEHTSIAGAYFCSHTDDLFSPHTNNAQSFIVKFVPIATNS